MNAKAIINEISPIGAVSKPVKFFSDSTAIEKDLQNLQRTRQRRATLLEEIRLAYQVVFGECEIKDVLALVAIKDEKSRRLEVVQRWLNTKNLTISIDLEAAINSRAISWPADVSTLILNNEAFLEEERDEVVNEKYFDKKEGRFIAPKITELDKKTIEERRSFYADAVAANVLHFVTGMAATINAANAQRHGQAVHLHKLQDVAPWLVPFVTVSKGELIVLPESILKAGEQLYAVDELKVQAVSGEIFDAFLDNLTPGQSIYLSEEEAENMRAFELMK
jgi:hypothetical protein